jgi:D-alanyl-D-alanine carboxypeptidase/D-alanyl-D-alanine-endopeptidase (penicillin-binding protein 4)
VRLTGVIAPSNGFRASLAVDDPALFAARAFHEALTQRGVVVHGRPAARHRASGETYTAPEGVELARRTSPPLVQLLRMINKVSQNLHAELVLREVGRVRRNDSSRAAGIDELHDFLAEAGIGKDAYSFSDGSGLSRRTLVTPDAIVQLLDFMFRSPHREEWIGLMPVGGEDGTLQDRFEGQPRGRQVKAKTGTLSHVSALAGYAEGPAGEVIAFSIVVNNHVGPSAAVRTVIDAIAMLATESPGVPAPAERHAGPRPQ